MTVVYFCVAVLGSVGLGVIFGTRLSPSENKASLSARLGARSLRVWMSLGAVIVASGVGALAIVKNHVLVGVAVLVAAYALQFAAIRVLIAKGRKP